MILIFSLSVSGQNGGQSPENNSVKLEYAGFQQVRVTNKQECTAVIRVDYSGTVFTRTIPGNSSILVATPQVGLFKAKTTTNCGVADFGFVELSLTSQLLPVRFVKFSANPQGYGNKVLISFEIAEATDVKQFNVQLSRDGSTWQTFTIIWPDNLQINKTYNMMLVLPKK